MTVTDAALADAASGPSGKLLAETGLKAKRTRRNEERYGAAAPCQPYAWLRRPSHVSGQFVPNWCSAPSPAFAFCMADPVDAVEAVFRAGGSHGLLHQSCGDLGLNDCAYGRMG
jgi:hypothetical protein